MPRIPTLFVPKATALFVCDIQARFAPLIHGFPAVVRSARTLIGCATALSIPVITTEQNPTRLGSTVAELCLPSPAIPKTRFSMLTNEVLRTLSDETCHVVLCGIEAHVCIAQTAHDLLREGFKVHIVVDGVSSQRRGDRAIALSALASAGAQLTSTEAVAFALLGDAAHPSFKEVQRLVMTHSRETLEADNTAGAVRLDTLV